MPTTDFETEEPTREIALVETTEDREAAATWMRLGAERAARRSTSQERA